MQYLIMTEMSLSKPNGDFLMLTFPVSGCCDFLCDPKSPWIPLNLLNRRAYSVHYAQRSFCSGEHCLTSAWLLSIWQPPSPFLWNPGRELPFHGILWSRKLISYTRSILIWMLYPCCGIVFGIYSKGLGRNCVCFVLTCLTAELCWRQTPVTHTHSNTTFRCNIDLQNNSAQLPSFTCEYRRSSIPNKLLAFLPIYKLEFPLSIW